VSSYITVLRRKGRLMYLATICPWVLAFAHPSQPGLERLGVVRRGRDKGKEIHFFVRA